MHQTSLNEGDIDMATNTKLELLTADNCQLIFIDQQPQMAFGVQSIDRQVLKNNTVALAKAAKVFDIPTTINTVETLGFSGHTYPELLASDAPRVIHRSSRFIASAVRHR
jgi:nicotinamidase-related amidase